VSIAGYVVLTVIFRKVGRRWTAYCEELGTATFGRSLTEAEKRIKEAIVLHLNTLEEVGERERFFKEHDIEFYHTRPRQSITVCLPPTEEVFVQPYIQPIAELSIV